VKLVTSMLGHHVYGVAVCVKHRGAGGIEFDVWHNRKDGGFATFSRRVDRSANVSWSYKIGDREGEAGARERVGRVLKETAGS